MKTRSEVSRVSSGPSTGFTIIELLVVITIIGLFSAVLFGGITAARGKGRLASAMQSMKSMHDIAMVCLSTNPTAYTFCLPGQGTAPCNASPLNDTNNGGGPALCANNPSGRYEPLPAGWIYCNATANAGQNSATNCGSDASSLPANQTTYFIIKAQSYSDGWVITCNESGCSSAADTN